MWEATLESRVSFLNVELRCLLDIRMEVSEKQSEALVYSKTVNWRWRTGLAEHSDHACKACWGLAFIAAPVNDLLSAHRSAGQQSNGLSVFCSAPHKAKAEVLAGQSSRLAPLGGSSAG